MSLRATASQTVGPFFSIGFTRGYVVDLAGPEVRGERTTVRGRLLDGDGRPVSDGCVEIWQADAEGRYGPSGELRGFGRVATNGEGVWKVTTIRPGRVAGPDGKPQAAHLVVGILARGLMRRLATRMYFPGDGAHADDPVLARVPPARRDTLIARPSGPNQFEWDIVLQGINETVFFDC